LEAKFTYESDMYNVLFVCTGNICRSPTAEGVLRHHAEKLGLSDRIRVDSAGTHNYHAGEAPDQRAVAIARKRGILIDGLKARKVAPGDFYDFDLILALDYKHLQFLRRMSPDNPKAQTELFLEFAGSLREKEVPDPYYGDHHHFEYVLDLIDSGVKPLLEKIQQQLR
jgi:protein-tyrosine phosphatase